MLRRLKSWTVFGMIALVMAGCSAPTVLQPKGPVASQQSDLIIFSIIFMLTIVAVVFVLLVVILLKYRDRKENPNYDPDHEGNIWLEVVWTVIPVIIVIALSIPTVQTIYSLEEPPEATRDKEPLVVHATSVNWKWIFSYPEQDIETVNYLNIPVDQPILFKLTSADSMAALWIPQLGGQKYNMAGMQTQLYLQADHEGTFAGRNANFTGEGFEAQRFDVNAISEEEFEDWVEETHETAPELTQAEYDLKLMIPGHVDEMTFKGTHLDWIDHATSGSYALEARERLGYEERNPNSKAPEKELIDPNTLEYYTNPESREEEESSEHEGHVAEETDGEHASDSEHSH
ncbi:cytochrome aa3 quinol oxidase subunit II [Bacillaceae bacterium SIJ1]|uniref:cytochrome aa3 quinol oxidase subunit II n=1 Tax=Litoribacterium kuwaitense TaxID=1398745 RepID=UPI0013EB89D5|nr:cytochrome aa3 quinol oxidase subunit II [Litoribacterium kuwaitense]NGP45418.1 cytochrome aa3 quinol oxidase subunit II [Litoribacterium kuwaitense]